MIHLDSSSPVDVSLGIRGGRSKANQKEEQWWEEPGPQDPQDPQDPHRTGHVQIGPKRSRMEYDGIYSSVSMIQSV